MTEVFYPMMERSIIRKNFINNFKLPIYSVVGTVDQIVPGETLEDLALLKSENKVITQYEQGHLGIIFHNETVRKICEGGE
jgi:poly(3-hydroxyalkanoate) synthetase